MTYEEAIENLQSLISNDCTDTQRDFFEEIEMAIDALKKQIPNIPKGDYDSVPHHRCPNCNAAIRVYCDDPYDPACKFCGQAIDWSNEPPKEVQI